MLEGLFHILEVEVHVAVAGNELGNGACGVAQGVVGLAESVEPVEVGVDFGQLLVVDQQQGVDVFAHLLGAVESLEDFFLPLEEEGDGYDADGEHPLFLGDACHHGSGARAGASAHAGGDEHHLGLVVEERGDVVGALLSGEAGYLGVVARAETLGGGGADKEFCGHRRVAQGLAVGVADHKRNLVDVLLVHMVYGVVAAAAHAYHFDDYVVGSVVDKGRCIADIAGYVSHYILDWR